MTRQTLPDGSLNPAWVAARRGCLGASSIADILKVGRTKGAPSQTRVSLARKLAAERYFAIAMDNVSPDHPDISRGMTNEPLALADYQIIKGVLLDPAEWVEHPRIEGSGATPDAFSPEGGLVQVKSPRAMKMVSIMCDNEIPAEYTDQLDWELAVTGRAWNDFVLYNPDLPRGRHIWIRRHHRDDKRVAFLEEQVALFMDEVQVVFDYLCSIEFDTTTAEAT